MNITHSIETPAFEVRFASLFSQGRGFAFPCDGQGRVDLDALSERARNNYFYARAMIGREHGFPCVHALATAEGPPHH